MLERDRGNRQTLLREKRVKGYTFETIQAAIDYLEKVQLATGNFVERDHQTDIRRSRAQAVGNELVDDDSVQ